MEHPRLAIFGFSEAAMFLGSPAGPAVRAIISIHGRREFGVEADVPHRLDLEFDDVEVPPAGDTHGLLRAMARRAQAERNGLFERPPTPADAAAIIEFARRLSDLDGTVLCQCGAGMSRAPAAALICLAVWTGAGRERWCIEEIRRLRRGAVPHPGLVRLADEQLGRGGALVRGLV